MIELVKKFVPATDEVWKLQNGESPECKFFQEMAELGHYGGRAGSTRQGIYVCSPSGKFLASINSTNPDRVIGMMNRGLAAWAALTPEERNLSDVTLVDSRRRMEAAEPRGGLILAQYTRDLPDNADVDSSFGEKWNRETAWFSKQEARSMLPINPAVGQTHEFPRKLVDRLVALHLVDAVKGQTTHFQRSEVGDSQIAAKVVKVSGPLVELELSGQTESRSSKSDRRQSPHGVVTQLMGKATFDTSSGRFTQFEIVAVGRRWGYTQFNFRKRENRESNPIGFVFRLADEDEAPNVPAFIWAYNVNWLDGRR